MAELAVVSAFLVGLLGGVHCAAMCGGIVGAISFGGSAVAVHRTPPATAYSIYHLAYSVGRIGSYTVAGTIAGWIGSGSLLFDDLFPVRTLLYVLASLMLVAQGLYLAGVWNGVATLERAGGKIWIHIKPWSRRLLPVDSAAKAAALGALWGWLPCAMVYSVLTVAVASGRPLSGALTMLAFGLGTLPNLLAMGFAAERMRPLLKNVRLRRIAGAVVITFGAIGLVRAVQPINDHGAALSLHESNDHGRTGH